MRAKRGRERGEEGRRGNLDSLRMNAVTWAAALVLPYTAIYTHSLINDTVMRWKCKESA